MMLSLQKDMPVNFLVIYYVVSEKVWQFEKTEECPNSLSNNILFQLIDPLDIIRHMSLFFRKLFEEKTEKL